MHNNLTRRFDGAMWIVGTSIPHNMSEIRDADTDGYRRMSGAHVYLLYDLRECRIALFDMKKMGGGGAR